MRNGLKKSVSFGVIKSATQDAARPQSSHFGRNSLPKSEVFERRASAKKPFFRSRSVHVG